MNRFNKDEKVECLSDTNLEKNTLWNGEIGISKRPFPKEFCTTLESVETIVTKQKFTYQKMKNIPKFFIMNEIGHFRVCFKARLRTEPFKYSFSQERFCS